MDNVYRFDVGALRCTAVNDGSMAGSAAMLFANAPDDALAAALARHGERPRRCRAPGPAC